MIKGFFLPSTVLRPYIDRYWFWEATEKTRLPRIFPGTGMEFFFHYKDPFLFFPRSHLLSSRNINTYELHDSSNIGFIAVRFKSWAFNYFAKIPGEKLNDARLSAQEIWSTKGLTLESQLTSVATNEERVGLLNTFFEGYITQAPFAMSPIDWAINYIYYNYDNTTIDQVIKETDLVPRTFQRKFKNRTGLDAKHFQLVSRFQTVLKKSLLQEKYPDTDMILKNGYYDQSHFHKDFKQLTGTTPSEILVPTNFMSHFYNTSIK